MHLIVNVLKLKYLTHISIVKRLSSLCFSGCFKPLESYINSQVHMQTYGDFNSP